MERNPYYHIEVEEAIIGALFLDGELMKECTLVPELTFIHRTATRRFIR